MKALLSEQYYFEKWDSMLEEYGREADLEGMLEQEMRHYTVLSSEIMNALEKVTAKRIADNCKDSLMKKMAMIKSLDKGESSLGYTTKSQTIDAMRRLRQGFEFTCLALREFKKNHGID